MTVANLWSEAAHAQAYLDKRGSFPRGDEGMTALVEWVSPTTRRVLDLGTGDGPVLASVLELVPGATGVAVDFSAHMLDAAAARFSGDERVHIVAHDLSQPLPAALAKTAGLFDLVVSGFAIHHVDHDRKRALYGEVFDLLAPGGAFLNLEHVASPTDGLHRAFLIQVGMDPDDDDPSNQLLDVETQLRWLRELGYAEVDCHWKWRELALLAGVRPEG